MQPLDLNPHDLEIVLAILQKFVPDREVWAFGSRVKWTAKPFSDLDLAVIGDQPLPAGIAADLAEAFDESELPIKVDVVDWATTSESFRKIIQRDKVVLQEKVEEDAVSPVPTIRAGSREFIVGSADWIETTLGEIAKRNYGIVDGPFGSNLPSSKYTLHGVPVIRGSNLSLGAIKFIDDKFVFVSEETAQELERSLCCQDDIIFTKKGTLGQTGFVPRGHKYRKFLLSSNQMKLSVDEAKANPMFIYYVVSSPASREKIIRDASVTGVPKTNIAYLKSFPIRIPKSVIEQQAIGRCLGELDDKIEVNRRQSFALADMARSLFQSWFVDFDPVCAKAKGHAPFGLDAECVSLFIASFEESDLGEIPAGWAATTLADIVTERTGKVGTANGHVVLSAVASGELKRSAEHFTKQVHSQDTSKYKCVEQWDYAYNPSRINIGSIGMLEEPIVGAVSPVYTVLRPAQGYEWFLRFFLDLPQTKEVINQFCSGSVRQSLSFKDFAAIPVVLPSKEIAEAFTRRWQELNALRQQLELESAKLAEVRDTLLPKLMSGELRVPDELMA